MSGVGEARWSGGLAPHQRQALELLAERWATGRNRAWLVLPPGSGKTLVGLEAARRLGRRTVVFAPNAAVQGQWAAQWRSFERPEGCTAGVDRRLRDDVTVLTYSSLALFDPDAETDEEGRPQAQPKRLHGNGSALLDTLRAEGPLTLVLDECHHLLQAWGRLLGEILSGFTDVHVIGLTGTPTTALTPSESALVTRLFGEPLRGASTPALVREARLAPFAEFAWITEPTPAEHAYIGEEGQRFADLCADLLSPGFASTDFLPWLRARFHERVGADGTAVPWSQISAETPERADAVLRLHHAGLCELPPGARLVERHRRPPRAEDWTALLGDYVTTGLQVAAPSPDDEKAIERIRAALPSVGCTLTKRGIRAARSPVDRVLARSSAKGHAAVEIAAAEAATLGEELRALILCDHERATSHPSTRLREVLADDAGSAWAQLDLLVADERTRPLAPMLVTGRTVAAAPDVAEAFVAWVRRRRPNLRLDVTPTEDGRLARVEGSWTPRHWVRLATAYFTKGASRLLVGTRALLGEGWDAPALNTIVDLTTATTATAVTQSRGRALRLDPRRPGKAAHTWTVVCVSDRHPKGAADWDRFARKHEGVLGADEQGEVTSGISHIDPSFSSYAPPSPGEFGALNARMLARAADREATRARWRIGAPYTDELLPTLRVRPLSEDSATPARPVPGPVHPPEAIPAASGVAPREPLSSRPNGTSLLAGTATLAGGTVLLGLVLPAVVALVAAVAAGATVERLATRAVRERAATGLVMAASEGPEVWRFGYAVADALRLAGHSTIGAEGVRARPGPGGTYLMSLSGAGPHAASLFCEALEGALSPLVGSPRYVIARFSLAPAVSEPHAARRTAAAWLRGRAPVNPGSPHPVPALFARDRAGIEAFASAWNRWISLSEPVYTASPAGAKLLREYYATDSYPVSTSLRLTWS
ncbi:DEAD/DEAH box helicase family protein [Marinactinospora endophytica]